jgi:hypothetical protein
MPTQVCGNRTMRPKVGTLARRAMDRSRDSRSAFSGHGASAAVRSRMGGSGAIAGDPRAGSPQLNRRRAGGGPAQAVRHWLTRHTSEATGLSSPSPIRRRTYRGPAKVLGTVSIDHPTRENAHACPRRPDDPERIRRTPPEIPAQREPSVESPKGGRRFGMGQLNHPSLQ